MGATTTGVVFSMTPGATTKLAGVQHGGVLVGMLSVHAQPYIRSGALVRVLPQWIGERWQVWAGYAGRKHVPRKVQAFLEFLQTEFGDPELDPWLV